MYFCSVGKNKATTLLDTLLDYSDEKGTLSDADIKDEVKTFIAAVSVFIIHKFFTYSIFI